MSKTAIVFCCAQTDLGDNARLPKPYPIGCGMSEIAQTAQLIAPRTAATKLAFRPQGLEVERRVLFEQGPNYVGHETAGAQPRRLSRAGWCGSNAVRNPNGVELLSNICATARPPCCRARQRATHRVPLHRWTYQTDGKLMGAPHFPQNPAYTLTVAVANWNGMLFSGKRDIAKDLAKSA